MKTFASRTVLFPLVVKVTSCERLADRATDKPTGLFNMKIWLEELVSDGDATAKVSREGKPFLTNEYADYWRSGH